MFKNLREWFSSKKRLIETISILKTELQRAKESRVTVINKQSKPKDDPWHLIVASDKEYWIRPRRVSYVSPIEDFTFTAIIDGVERKFIFRSHDEASEVRNILLNIDAIPSANTYERKKEPSEILKDIDKSMSLRPRVTQEEIDSMDLRNVKK